MSTRIDGDSLYSVDELASMFEVSSHTIRRLIRRTGLPLRRVGHKRFVQGMDFLDATLHDPDDEDNGDGDPTDGKPGPARVERKAAPRTVEYQSA